MQTIDNQPLALENRGRAAISHPSRRNCSKRLPGAGTKRRRLYDALKSLGGEADLPEIVAITGGYPPDISAQLKAMNRHVKRIRIGGAGKGNVKPRFQLI